MNPSELTKFKLDLYADLVRDRSLSAVDLRVGWLLLFKYLNRESMTAWPSVKTLAADLGTIRRTVQRSMARLTTPGGYFIVKTGGGRGQSNRYEPNTERAAPTTPINEQETAAGETPFSEETAAPVTVKGVVPVQETAASAPPDSFEWNPTMNPLREGARARRPTNSHSGEGTRIDPAWQPGLTECEVGYELGYDDRAVTAEADKFRDHYLGNGEKREDWNAVFRTWLRRAPSFEGRGQGRASANTERQDRLGLIAGLALDKMGSSRTARLDAEEAERKMGRDRRRAADLRRKIQWCEGQEIKLETSFAGPIAEAKEELSRLSGEVQA